MAEFSSLSREDTHMAGIQLGRTLERGDVVLLYGGVGAGKTVFASGLAAALAIEEYITSPTFTIMNEYHSGAMPLYHFDAYRLAPPQGGAGGRAPADGLCHIDGTCDGGSLFDMEGIYDTMEEIGFFECCSRMDGVVVLEWPQRLGAALPDEHIKVAIERPADDGQAGRYGAWAHGGLSSAAPSQEASHWEDSRRLIQAECVGQRYAGREAAWNSEWRRI